MASGPDVPFFSFADGFLHLGLDFVVVGAEGGGLGVEDETFGRRCCFLHGFVKEGGGWVLEDLFTVECPSGVMVRISETLEPACF